MTTLAKNGVWLGAFLTEVDFTAKIWIFDCESLARFEEMFKMYLEFFDLDGNFSI